MTEKPAWQKPIFLDPESVRPVVPEVPSAKPITPREIDPRHLLAPIDDQKQNMDVTSASGNPWAKRFGKALLLLVSLSGGIGLGQLILWGSELHALIGGALAGLVVFMLGCGGFALWREVRGIRQLKGVQKLREDAVQVSVSVDHGRAAVVLDDISEFYGQHPLSEEFAKQRHALDPRYNNAEYLQQLSRRTLQPIDKALYQLVTRRSLESAVLVGISPMVSLDMLLMLWRNTRMLSEISTHYGLQTSFSTRLYLLKQVLHNLAFVGVSEAVIGSGNELLGASVMGTVSARAGQGIAAGVMTARLGLQAMTSCRPLPFGDEEQPSLSAIRGELMKQSRQLFRDNNERQASSTLPKKPTGNESNSRRENTNSRAPTDDGD